MVMVRVEQGDARTRLVKWYCRDPARPAATVGVAAELPTG